MLKLIDRKSYIDFSDFLESATGIALGAGKEYLLEMRLRPLLQRLPDVNSLRDLMVRAKTDRSVHARMIDALTTNETSWFRDRYPYEYLQNIIFPALIKKGTTHIKCWSAACSSGQEPYSIAMSFEEMRRHTTDTLRLGILATEISDTMLEEASKGCYSERSVARGLASELKSRYLLPCTNGWQVIPTVRGHVEFRKFNLVYGKELASFDSFDVIFCRNVLIYFTAEVKASVLTRLAKTLKTDGYLILGASEYVSNGLPYFKSEKIPSGFVYRRTSVAVKSMT